ncbi:glycine zipper 2TM domain-containing protein [Noviherbaspirillum sp. Root189]|uniref:glycine zipper 2TM domain-containing protein n=1 Tax=Noviherbaspirillum sp. Root189 TaxID=1736487 RepID=UPI0009EBCB35|nr:glycine zipper 2TM domain-containing protein [Noviherbaspirillum sp. Root189]
MKAFATKALASLLVAGMLTACASPGYGPVATQPYPSSAGGYPAGTYPSRPYPATSPSYAYSYGTVDSIQVVQGQGAPAANNGIGLGTVVGGVVGGLLGNQVGSGSGRKAATVAGVVGGAVVGNQMEQRNGQVRDAYQVGVRMDNGSYRTVVQDNVADLYVGGRVRIENDRAYRQ